MTALRFFNTPRASVLVARCARLKAIVAAPWAQVLREQLTPARREPGEVGI